MADCRSCGAGVLWATTEQGRRIPLDPDPDQKRGTFYLRPRNDGSLTAVSVPVLDRASVGRAHQLHVAHFATCPNADRHRRSS